MKRYFALLLFVFATALNVSAQVDMNRIDESGNITRSGERRQSVDSLGTDKEIPKGLKVWSVDKRFGDIRSALPDTMSHMYMNTIFTTGLRGEYNTTGNLGSPRINRVFADRKDAGQFIFTEPYDYFIKPVETFHFTNTLSPITNLSYNTCGDRTNGEDHFTAKFGVNAGKRLGVGFNFDYLYGRGYYQNQSTSHFNYTMYGSYLGDRYQAHLLMSTNHQKITENGGITNDNYVTHPEIFNDSYQTSEIPVVLSNNWNRNDNQHVFFTQRYSLGFHRKVKMTEEEIEAKKFAKEAKKDKEKRDKKEREERKAKREGKDFDEKSLKDEPVFAGRPDDAKIAGDEPAAEKERKNERIAVNGKAAADSLLTAEEKAKEEDEWMKKEFVPVTSFIHTLKFDNFKRIYQAYDVPEGYYADTYDFESKYGGDSIYDKTKHYQLQNTFAISLLEGFNKWAKAGLKAFATSSLRHFTLPDSVNATSSYNEHNISVGGELSKTQGNTLHYNVLAETWLVGEDAGQISVEGNADLNFRLLGDTVTLAASAFLHHLNPTFYYRHYHSRHFWWDNDDLSKIIHSRIQGVFRYKKTRTTLRVAFDELKNYTYFGHSYSIDTNYDRIGNSVQVMQCSDAISLVTATLSQDFTFGPLNWESQVTWQKSSNGDVLAMPDFNVYTNLYLNFKVARVLTCNIGADARYFTKYAAPDYCPALGQFTTQTSETKTELGGYPIINAYANFHLKHTRFFVMMSNVGASIGHHEYFLTPHYPLNGRTLRFGVSWNFFN